MRNDIDIDEAFKGILKMLSKDYVVYNRKYLKEHLDIETDSIEKWDLDVDNSKFINLLNEIPNSPVCVDLVSEEDFNKYFEDFKKSGICSACNSKNCQGTYGWAKTCASLWLYIEEKERKKNESRVDELFTRNK